MPISLAGPIQVGLPKAAFAEAGTAGHRLRVGGGRSATRWSCASRSAWWGPSPRGTTRWYQIALKVAPAIAAGCTVVLKPSEVAPLNAFALAEAIDEAVAAPPASSTW